MSMAGIIIHRLRCFFIDLIEKCTTSLFPSDSIYHSGQQIEDVIK